MKWCKATPSRQVSIFFIIIILLALLTAQKAYADTGPHPFVTVSSTNLPESVHYATLLADKESYGPYHAITKLWTSIRDEEQCRATEIFLKYAEQYGYYYWGYLYEIKDGSFRYPPERFIIIIYDADSDTVYTSAETERYDFDSFYRVTLQKDGTLGVERESHLFERVYNISVRLITTLLVEILIALIFGYRSKKELFIIVLTNILTQALLNWYLIVGETFPDTLIWMVRFLAMELAVFIGEAVVYALIPFKEESGALCYRGKHGVTVFGCADRRDSDVTEALDEQEQRYSICSLQDKAEY